jgi:hypothetical protein
MNLTVYRGASLRILSSRYLFLISRIYPFESVSIRGEEVVIATLNLPLLRTQFRRVEQALEKPHAPSQTLPDSRPS